MRGNSWSKRLGVAAVCVQAASLAVVAHAVRRAPLLDDAAAADTDLSQSVQRDAGVQADHMHDDHASILLAR